MNTEAFTGKAQAYAEARPGYPDEVVEYVCKLAPTSAIFADIGAGTGKFTELLARYGNEIYAVEPNADMRKQLAITLTLFPNVKIVDGTAEATTLSDYSIDVITCAQAIGWFDLNAFRGECHRIGKSGVIIVSIYHYVPGDSYIPNNNRLTNKKATEIFFTNPAVQDFSYVTYHTREVWLQKWIQGYASVSDNPRLSDAEYEAHIAEANKIFDRDSVDGLLRKDSTVRVYSEKM